MASIKGKWVFKNTLTFSEFFENVNFTSNNTNYYKMAYYNPDMANYVFSYDESGGGDYITVNYSSDAGRTQEWQNEEYRTVDFGTTEQTVSEEFLTWMQANAIQQTNEEPKVVTVSYNGNTIATLESGDTAILHCADKKMTADISVTAPKVKEVKLQEKTITENCEAIPDEGYDGFSKVTVDVPIPDGYIVPSGTKDIVENGTSDVTEFASVNVNIPIEEVEEYDGMVTVADTVVLEPLMLPSISIEGDNLNIASTDLNIDTYAIYVDGEKKAVVDNNIEEVTMTIYNCDGSDIVTTLAGASPAEVVVIENRVNVIWADKSVSEYAFEGGAEFLGLSLTATTSDTNNAAIYNNSVSLLTEDTSYYAFLEPIAPTISIEGDILTITAGDQATETFVIQPGSIVINRTGDNTIVDLSTTNIAFGNQNIYVYAKIDCIMSDNSNTVTYYKAPPADSKSLTVNITGYSYGASYWVDKEPFGGVSSDSYVSSGGSIAGIMDYVFLQSNWASYTIPPSAISNCSIEFYDRNGNKVTSGYGCYAKVYNIGESASIKLYDND